MINGIVAALEKETWAPLMTTYTLKYHFLTTYHLEALKWMHFWNWFSPLFCLRRHCQDIYLWWSIYPKAMWFLLYHHGILLPRMELSHVQVLTGRWIIVMRTGEQLQLNLNAADYFKESRTSHRVITGPSYMKEFQWRTGRRAGRDSQCSPLSTVWSSCLTLPNGRASPVKTSGLNYTELLHDFKVKCCLMQYSQLCCN